MGETGGELPLPVAGEAPASEIRERLFPHHMKGFARVNHGSYGSAPLPVLEAQANLRMRCLAQPDLFLNKQLEGLMLDARREVASEVGCRDVNHLVLLDNVTTAAAMIAALTADSIRAGAAPRAPAEDTGQAGTSPTGAARNAAASDGADAATWQPGEDSQGRRNWGARPGDVVLMSSHSYDAVRKSFEHFILPAGGVIQTVALPFPHPTPEAVLRSFLEAAEGVAARGRRVALAVVDHVSSMPALVLPVSALVSGLHARGVRWVFVDGAHAVGSVAIDVESLGADFYASNLHKWAFGPLSAAFLHCKHAALLGPGAGARYAPESRGSSTFTCASGHSTEDARVCAGSSDSSNASTSACNKSSVLECNIANSNAASACTTCGTAHGPLRQEQVPALDAKTEHPMHPGPAGTTSGTPGASSKGAPGVRLHHPVVSHGYDTGLGGECFYTGTRDYSAMLAAPMGLRVGRALGGGSFSGVREHNHKGVVSMARMLADAWGTSLSVPEEMCASMAMVALPPMVRVASQEAADVIRDRLREEFRVEAPILYVEPPLHASGNVQGEGRVVSGCSSGHVRISYQVYNTEEDYKRLRDAVLAVCEVMEGNQRVDATPPVMAP